MLLYASRDFRCPSTRCSIVRQSLGPQRQVLSMLPRFGASRPFIHQVSGFEAAVKMETWRNQARATHSGRAGPRAAAKPASGKIRSWQVDGLDQLFAR
jgi:hypothetical protein